MPTTHQHVPYTGDSDDYEEAITADNALPTAVGDANVNFRNTGRYIGPKQIVVSGRLYGTDATNISISVTFYQWNPRANAGSGAWIPCNGVAMIGTAGYPSLTAGQMGLIDVNPNLRHGYLRVNGLSGGGAAQSVALMAEKAQ